ncbi:fumarylacetoacetate hydrolase family protein [Undibacterium sp. RuRC25W]|uniref:fumarylacetoacetate hydrolase family protein n=1 Tax=Undibacterium sp. RuRC25W TaxID=3413047 RepID=UPI003BF17690
MPSSLSHRVTHFATASHILAQRRLNGEVGERLPTVMRPATIEDAMQVQGLLATHLQDEIAGWKCGMPTKDKIVVAPIFSKTVFRQTQGPVCKVSDERVVKIEPELAFILCADLPARATAYAEADVHAAISHGQIALEIIGCRYTKPAEASFPELLADGLFNQGLFLGPEIDLPAAQQAQEIAITLRVQNQDQQVFAGRHPAPHPLAPLYWLTDYLRQQGIGLRAGQAIITGSYAGSPDVPLNTDIQVQFAEFGSIEVHFARD